MAYQEVTVAPSAFEPVKFKLSSKIVTHAGLTDELTLKMPSAGAFVKFGMPYREKSSGSYPNVITQFDFDFGAVMGFLTEMTGVDPILLSSIPGNDMIPLATEVVRIVSFKPKAERTQSESSPESEKS